MKKYVIDSEKENEARKFDYWIYYSLINLMEFDDNSMSQ